MSSASLLPTLSAPNTFIVRVLRFHFEAQEPIVFGHAANTLRGALGMHLPGELFAPQRTGGPSGLADPPRPFVFRAAHLDGRRVESPFHFDVNLFTKDPWPIPLFEAAFRQFAHGVGGGKAMVTACDQRILELSFDPVAANQVTLEFVTPTELKGAEDPAFAPLIARLRDRIANLSEQYGNGPLDVDFKGLAERAEAVKLVSSDLTHVDHSRRSSRTSQTHPLSGFVGRCTYSGDLSEFMPYLTIGQYTGVGRQTVWGKGQLAIRT